MTSVVYFPFIIVYFINNIHINILTFPHHLKSNIITWAHIQYVFKIMSILIFKKILVKTNISSFDCNKMKHN